MASCNGCPIIVGCKVEGHSHVGACKVREDARKKAIDERRKFRMPKMKEAR